MKLLQNAKLRRFSAMVIALFLFLHVIPAHAGASIIIHYQRDDGAYGPWNIWSWAEGAEGAAYPWTGEDAYGVYAEIELPQDAARVGFIVRTDSWEKDVQEDRFIDLSQGNEIWVRTAQSEFAYEAPEGYAADAAPIPALNLKVHYNRYDGNYEGLTASVTRAGEEAAAITASPSDIAASFLGAEFNFALENLTTLDKLKLDFSNEAGLVESYDVPLRNVEGGALELLCVYGSRDIETDWSEPLYINAAATLDAPNEINLTVAYPIAVNGGAAAEEGFGITVGKMAEGESGFGENVPVKEITPLNMGGEDAVFGKLTEGYATRFLLTFGEDLDLGGKFNIFHEQVITPVEPGRIFESPRFDEVYYYGGNDLGVTYTADASSFRFWSPTASDVLLKYKLLTESEWRTVAMTADVSGTWVATIDGDLNGMEYVYSVTNSGIAFDIVDPYAKAVTVNGRTGAIVDLAATEPDGWDADGGPALANPTDAVIYELHVRDFSTHASSGISEANKGKFLAFTETGTTAPDGQLTGIDHLKELGVTHVHLLPSFDYASLDETTSSGFNWGYDPLNYNAPEGTYSTDATQPALRVREFKQAVQAMHENGIGVIMDMVYNHTGPTADSNLNRAVPGYYYRMTASGGFANGSACGNETASERAMVRKFIVDSVTYWAENYHIDGFRFDLMGLHDIDTMNAIRVALDEIDPSILMYGEGWTAGATPLPMSQQALKASMSQMDERIAAFSDDIRDGIKGSVFNAADPGYVSGYYGRKEQIKFGVAASVRHDQIDVTRLANSSGFWAAAPSQTITYASAHDNLTLWDKLLASTPNATEEEHLAMNRLSAAIVLTSQGIPFIHAGEEIARTKDGDENSYQSPDSVNQIKWDTKADRRGLFDFYKGLIALRKSDPAFRLTTAEEIRNNLVFLETEAQTLAYTLGGETLVAFNADSGERELTLPMDGVWAVLVDGERAGTEVLYEHSGATMTLAGRSAYVLKYQGEAPPEQAEPVIEAAPPAEAAPTVTPQPTEAPAAGGGVSIPLIAGIISPLLALAGLGVYLVREKKKNRK